VLAAATVDKDEFVRIAADISLRRIGAPASKHLKKFIESEDRQQYFQGCAAVKIIGPGATEWVPRLVAQLNSDDDQIQFASLLALEGVGRDALPALNRLIEFLRHKDFNIQSAACRVLANMGTDAAPAQDQLVKLLEEGNVSARSHAAIALGASGLSDRHDIVGLIDKRLDAFTQVEKHRALLALAHLGPAAGSSAERVRQIMGDPNKNVQPAAAYAYWKITGESEVAVQHLMKFADSADYETTSIELLGQMGTAAEKATDLLIKKLNSPEAHVREIAAQTLARLGPAASSAQQPLRKLLSDEDLLIRAAAEDALAAIASQTPASQTPAPK
jgi:HEAT repeat protein